MFGAFPFGTGWFGDGTPEGVVNTGLPPSADVTVTVRGDVGVIAVRPDPSVIEVRPDTGAVEL